MSYTDPQDRVPDPRKLIPDQSASQGDLESGDTGQGKPEEHSADILIVDNDERIVELLSWFLSKRGYSTQSAHSFGEAREFLSRGLPDLMLSDLDLGAESALVELPRLADDGILPPTLVVSGYLNAEVTKSLTAMPQVLGVLAKPFDFASLEERVVGCLEALARGDVVTTGSASPKVEPAFVKQGGWVEIHPQPRTVQPENARSGSPLESYAGGDSPAVPPANSSGPAASYRRDSVRGPVR
ncbi:MAG TPA: response regulator [Planctomycetes bacterium]|nr:response regulator [Planctomycetota bacterium]HIL37132.1 response regulator [Planctomycetota bacterium]